MSRSAKLALDGGQPVRNSVLPYGRQWVDENDVNQVVETLRSDWLTTGPAVEEFERAFAPLVELDGVRDRFGLSLERSTAFRSASSRIAE